MVPPLSNRGECKIGQRLRLPIGCRDGDGGGFHALGHPSSALGLAGGGQGSGQRLPLLVRVQLGVSAVAAPVFGPGGQVVAAIELPVRDLRAELPRLQPALVVAARGLSRQLGLVSNGHAVPVNEAPRHRSITEART
ncbi:MAG TPA: hypothetical protein VFI46_02175 [Jiangellaceae bacterium]|nr:hypothetical protein [Jiangellaceae bacterium]